MLLTFPGGHLLQATRTVIATGPDSATLLPPLLSSDWTATVAAAISLAGAEIARRSLGAANRSAKASEDAVAAAKNATETARAIARRQNIIDLHHAWEPVQIVDPSRPLIGPHVRTAVNALGLTATLWNHDVVEKEVLFQNYWEPFRDLYDALNSITTLVPGYSKSARDMLSSEVRRAYREMGERELSRVKQTSLDGGK